MSTAFVIIVATAAIAVGFLLSGHKFPRVLGAFVLVGAAIFCVFGFLASYEYSDPKGRRPWQIGYGVLGAACAGGAILLLACGRRK